MGIPRQIDTYSDVKIKDGKKNSHEPFYSKKDLCKKSTHYLLYYYKMINIYTQKIEKAILNIPSERNLTDHDQKKFQKM